MVVSIPYSSPLTVLHKLVTHLFLEGVPREQGGMQNRGCTVYRYHTVQRCHLLTLRLEILQIWLAVGTEASVGPSTNSCIHGTLTQLHPDCPLWSPATFHFMSNCSHITDRFTAPSDCFLSSPLASVILAHQFDANRREQKRLNATRDTQSKARAPEWLHD